MQLLITVSDIDAMFPLEDPHVMHDRRLPTFPALGLMKASLRQAHEDLLLEFEAALMLEMLRAHLRDLAKVELESPGA